MPLKNNFKFKLILSYFLIILISFSAVGFFLARTLEDKALEDIKTNIIKEARLIRTYLETVDLNKESRIYLDSLVEKLSLDTYSRITIIDTEGMVLADSERAGDDVLEMDNHSNRPEVIAASVSRIGTSIRFSSTLGINMLYVAIPVSKGGKPEGVLRVAVPLSNVENIILLVRKTVIISLVFALIFAVLLALVTLRGITMPLNRIISVSKRFSQGDFSRRIIYKSKDEIGELATTVNNMAQNIEERVKEVELRKNQIEAIFNSMTEGVVLLDRDSRIISINSSAEKLLNADKRGTLNKLFLEAVPSSDIYEVIEEAIKTKSFLSREIAYHEGPSRIFKINASTIISQGEISACLLVIHDITELRRLESIRKDFVANISHEIKTPLTSIKGFVETLLEGAISDKENSQQFLKIIQDHTERLNNLVNDLLKLSYLESKEISLNMEELDIKGIIDGVILGFKSQLKKKGIAVENNLAAGLRLRIDREKIEQLLTNLIDNAIKFNKDGGFIKIYSDVTGGKLKITIEDSGIGIPEKDIPRIFERFYRVDKARSRALGGTGLGLSIVKHVAKLHNGDAGVESIEGLGSKFWFILPI